MQEIINKPYDFFSSNNAGQLNLIISKLSKGIPRLINDIIEKLFGNLVAIIVALYVSYIVSVNFSIMLVMLSIAFTMLAVYSSENLKHISGELAEVESEVASETFDIMANIFNIKLFNKQYYEISKLKSLLVKFSILEQKQIGYTKYAGKLQHFIFIIFQSAAIALLAYGIKVGNLTIGDFLLIFYLNINILNNLESIFRNTQGFMTNLGDIYTSVYKIFDFEKKQMNSTRLEVKKGVIEFKNITFGYRQDKPLFNNLSLTIKAGEKVAIIGRSGSGKSSLVKLIVGIIKCQAGNIFIDGQNIEEVTPYSLNECINFVQQENYLFNRSISENIAYYKAKPDENEIKLFLESLCMEDLVHEGWDLNETKVGMNGNKLSGGQRQRISLSRIFFKKAPIFIFDECYSQLDSITENKIHKKIRQITTSATTIFISHKKFILKEMDRIIVLDKGKVIADGKYKTLIKTSNFCKNIIESN